MADTDLNNLLLEADLLHTRAITALRALVTAADHLYRKKSNGRALARDSIAPGFNVFRLTERANYEVTTHQTVIADLLNPNGSHGQGNLFLKPFLKLVRDRIRIELPEADSLWEVDQGRSYIDIRLRYPDTMDSIVIEVKWNAGDRRGQVVDYWREERRRTAKVRIPLVFLSQNGRPPDLGDEADDHGDLRQDLICLSFRSEFAELLTNSLRDVAAQRVRETLHQYLDLLAALPADSEERTYEA